MTNGEPNQDPLNELPDELDGYTLRLLELGYLVLEYSKKPMFGRYHNPELFSEEDLKENLLFDAKADTIEEAVAEMRVKVQEYRNENPE